MLHAESVSLRSSDDRLGHSGETRLRSGSLSLISPSGNGVSGADEWLSQGQNRADLGSSTVSNSNLSLPQGTTVECSEGASNADSYAIEASRELAAEQQPIVNERGTALRMWHRPSEIPAELLEFVAQVKRLVESLKSSSVDEQRNATLEIRLLAKQNMENHVVIANCGTIPLLVNLLLSTDLTVQENAVTALLNLSIDANNKRAIANADAIEPLIHVLKSGSPEAKENSAATFVSLSVTEENKIKIGRSGAIKDLVDLLRDGTPRGVKDAANALFNLSILHENKARVVHAGGVKYLVELLDPAFGMVDWAVAVLANLATIYEGRTAIGKEGGIPVLVEVVEVGSARSKENAAATLLQLCINRSKFCNLVLHECAFPPLAALSRSGTPRAKEKAQALLVFFRNLRRINSSRG